MAAVPEWETKTLPSNLSLRHTGGSLKVRADWRKGSGHNRVGDALILPLERYCDPPTAETLHTAVREGVLLCVRGGKTYTHEALVQCGFDPLNLPEV